MAENTIPIFPKAIKVAVKKPTAVITILGAEGHANLVDLVVGGADGSRVLDCSVNSGSDGVNADVSGVSLIFFINDGVSDYHLLGVSVTASMGGSASGVTFPAQVNSKGLFLPSGYKLRFGVVNGLRPLLIRVHAKYVDY